MTLCQSIATVLAITFATCAANAGIVVEVTQPAVLPGYTAYGIYWDGGGTEDWTSAELIADLAQGTFYQDTLGGDGAPTSAFFPIVPTLEFDTYFGIIDDGSAGLCGGGAVLGSGCAAMLDQHIEGNWFNTNTYDTGYIKIGNFTVTNDAIGTWQIASAGVIYEGIIPEPASVALCALVFPALLARRSHV